MKALTLHQPWAQACVLGLKQNETRSYRTHHRGLLAIHSSLDQSPANKIKHYELNFHEQFRVAFKNAEFSDLPFGCIVGVVDVVACVPVEEVWPALSRTDHLLGNYNQGRFAWRLENPRKLDKPIPARGYQGLWNLSAHDHATLAKSLRLRGFELFALNSR